MNRPLVRILSIELGSSIVLYCSFCVEQCGPPRILFHCLLCPVLVAL